MADWISPLQRGFLHGRSMLHNVMDVEQAAMEVSLQDADAAMLLFDFAAAFPSLGPELIEETLAHLGLPAEVLATVAALYDGNHCSLIAGGCRHRGFPMLRGLRQGCPLSPLLYVLVADSLLRALAAAVPTATVRGYADDTAMVLQQWRTHWPAIQQIFTRFAAVSGLDLNIGKTVLIPLGDESCEAVRASLAAAGDLWMDIEVARWGRYLGFAVGPGREQNSWSRLCAKFCDRLRDWPWAQLGLHLAVRVFNIFLLPTLTFVAQLETPAADLLRLVAAASTKIAPGPYRWILPEDLCQLRSLFGFPVELKDLLGTTFVTQLRVARWEAHAAGGLQTAQRCRRLEECERHTLFPQRIGRWRNWYMAAHARTLKETQRQLMAMGISPQALEDRLADGSQRPWMEAVACRVRRGFQRAASRAMPAPHDAALEQRLRHKLIRWQLLGFPPRVTRLVLARLRSLRGRVQPRAHAASIRVICNGVLTARRFQQDAWARGCQLGCPQAEDALEHYARCPCLRAVARTSLGLDLPVGDFRAAFFFGGPRVHDETALRPRWQRMALVHYALHRTLCAARNHPAWQPRSMAVAALRQALREGVSPAAGQGDA